MCLVKFGDTSPLFCKANKIKYHYRYISIMLIHNLSLYCVPVLNGRVDTFDWQKAITGSR